MTDSEEIAALRQEVENWKLLAVEQARRLDLTNKRLNDYINREYMPPPLPPTAGMAYLCLGKGGDKRLEGTFECIWDVLTWIDARLVAIEKQPGIVPKKGWVERKAILNDILIESLFSRMGEAMSRIDPS